jgi:sulfopyruvate decarboxylase subunit beta
MRRYDCLAALGPAIQDELVVTNLGGTGYEWFALRPREGNLYTMGMGLVTPVCLGMALALPHRRVVALDGDGSLLLNLGVLTTIASKAPPNLTVVVFDNQAYAATGGLPTATAGPTDLAAMAQGAGIRHASTVRTVEAFRDATARALAQPGPWFVVAKVSGDSEPSPPKLMDGRENKYRFVRYVEETEGATILRPSVDGPRSH